jgi:hypothetical protein
MTFLRAFIVMALPLLTAASVKVAAGSANGEFAEGALSLLVSKRCEKSPTLDTKSIDWNALVYAAGRPPSWGRKAAGACRGLDTWVLSEAVGAGALWSQGDHAAIEADPMKTLFDDMQTHAAFKRAFGWELPERGDDVPPPNVFLKYDAKKVSLLFDRIYVKPADKIGVVTGQEVYDVFFKGFITRLAREVTLIKGGIPKPQLAKMLKDYQAAAQDAGAHFQGPTHLRQAAASALPKDQEQAARASRTLGVILRRTADGTWPTVNRLLDRIVRDYDPALSRELARKP